MPGGWKRVGGLTVMMWMTRYLVCASIVGGFLLASCKETVREEQLRTTVKFPPAVSVALNGDRFLWLVTGEAGEIVRTSDGGETWERSVPPPEERFWQVCFIDPSNGWAVTDHSSICRTSDGGATWLKIARLPYDDGLSEHANDQINFIDDNTGWVVDPISVWRTEDGGHNWSQSQPDLLDDGWAVQLLQTYFVDSHTGWATGTGGFCYSTTDGGRSWARKPRVCDGGCGDLFFLDHAIGWTVCGTSGIFGTENGGNDWFEAHLPEVGVTNPDENILVTTLAITSRYEGWAAGAVESYDADSKFQSRAILLHTSDGGRNWLEVPVGGEERIYYSVRFADSSVGWLFGGDGKVYRTADGGHSWMLVLTLPVD
jgi:photosystem II stability/assembly factor-like uncharacterized protein